MQAGKLRHLVTLEAPITVRNAVGEVQITGWTQIATLWASIEPLSTRDLLMRDISMDEVDAKVTIRPVPGIKITDEMRINRKGEFWELRGSPIDKDARGIELTLLCSHGKGDG